MSFYDGAKLLSLHDLTNQKPEIFISTSNRSAGKTTYFNRLCVNRFIKKQEKFCLVYRFKYELDSISNKFFKDIQELFFENYEMTNESRGKGVYHELFLNGVSCGYAVALNCADQIKKYSHLLSDTKRMLFDEFQSETNNYCSREVEKLISIHTSIARGGGKQVRYVPVYMISNQVSVLNPYYTILGIGSRLQNKTKYLKGNGWVFENSFNETASKAQVESGFNRAFAGSKYVAYASQNIYLNDNYSFIENVSGKNRYLSTIRYNGKNYAIRSYDELGIIYCDEKVDYSFPSKISVTTDDLQVNYVNLRNNSMFISNMRYFFDNGCFRFKNLACKEAIFMLLSY